MPNGQEFLTLGSFRKDFWLQVVQVIIYQERQSEASDAQIHVKVFVEFETYEEVNIFVLKRIEQSPKR